jgi:branched-chain amino acid aminotransferase
LNYANINGQLVPAERVEELINSFSVVSTTGLFETMLVLDGVIQLKDYHWERLSNGLSLSGMPTLDTNLLEKEIIDLIRKNSLVRLCKVRVQVYHDSARHLTHYLIESNALQPEIILYNTQGLISGITETWTKKFGPLANCKTTNRTLYHAAEKYAKTLQWNEALIRNEDGRIIETSICNVFWVKENVVYTPPLSEGCVAGTMRRFLIAELPTLGYAVEEHLLTEPLLYEADEVFFSNAIRRIKWVVQIDNQTYSNHLSSEIASLLFY